MTRVTYPEPDDLTTVALLVDGQLKPVWRFDAEAAAWPEAELFQHWFHDPNADPQTWEQITTDATMMYGLVPVTHDGDLHPGPDVADHFELTYGTHLPLHRTLLQSMPEHWQRQLVALLRDYDDAFQHVKKAPCYQVTPAEQRELWELDALDLAAAGVTAHREDPEGDDHGDGDGTVTYYDAAGTELEPRARVYVPLPDGDPVPHYNGGRTRVEPQLRRPARPAGDPGD